MCFGPDAKFNPVRLTRTIASMVVVTIASLSLNACSSTTPASDLDRTNPTGSTTTIVGHGNEPTTVTLPTNDVGQSTTTQTSVTAANSSVSSDVEDGDGGAGSTTTLSATTTTAPLETMVPEAETFEPEAPSSGFVTYEPNA
tara:strand:- start:2636 stop:3061 length:426 start_codon:yes stop_codon:yes gene_type:complete